MDEPTSALDPISTSKIEELALELKKDYTIIFDAAVYFAGINKVVHSIKSFQKS